MENNLFKIHSEYKPTGDQPAAIDSIVKNIENGVKDQVLLGVTGSGKTFTIANVIERMQRPSLIIAPNKTLAAQLYSEYKKFFPENAVEYFVSYYDYYQPEAYIKTTDTYIEKDSSVNDEIDKLRNAATAALIHRRDVIIVASVSSIYGLGSPDTYRRMTIPIDKKTGISRKELMKKLIALRYDRNDVAFERGQFRIKGDVIDIYPSYMSNGYRLEYWGDDLEEISEINTLTGQKVKKNLERIVIYPATQYLTADDDKERIIKEIKDDLKVEVKKFEDDKKLVGYVIVAEILSNTKQAVVKVVTTTQANVNPTNSSIEETKKDKVNIKLTISDIKNNWNSILAEANNKRLSYRAFLMGAIPIKIENNTLFINYDRKFKFAKEQMETTEYNQEFTKIVREFFNEDNLEIKYEVVGQKKDEENNNSEFFKKIENYFKGEN